MTRKRIHSLTLCLVLLFLLAGPVRARFFPDAEVPYENRSANLLPAFRPETFLDGSFQEDFEAALSDQVPQAIRMKKLYNIYDTALALPVIRALGRDGGYVGFRDVCFFEDMLVVKPVPLSQRADALSESAGKISAWAAQNPGTAFFVYYIETDKDLNLETGERCGLFDAFSSALTGVTLRRLPVESFSDYRRFFLKSDHHWNADGVYYAYQELCGMLGVEPLPLLGQHTVPGCYLGTRAAGVEGFPAEDFSVNLFDWPEMEISIPFGVIPDYGLQAAFAADGLESVSYGSVFGFDCGELVFRTGKPGQRLLVMGDSYDNALAKTLAASFSEARFIDLRSYASETGEAFDLNAYVRAHEIDRVLFIGALDYFSVNLLA